MDTIPDESALRNLTLAHADIAPLAGRPHKLVDCDLEEGDFAGLDLTGWTFERCALRRSSFNGARLERTRWQSCRGAFVDLTGSDLTDANIVSSDFNNASFKRSTLRSATFAHCKLTGADLSDIKGFDVTLHETLAINAKLPGISFRKATLNRIDFSQADLRKCDFRAATFEDCSLRDANLTGARFEGADLRGADLGGLRLIDATLFKGATISRQQAGQLLSELGISVR